MRRPLIIINIFFVLYISTTGLYPVFFNHGYLNDKDDLSKVEAILRNSRYTYGLANPDDIDLYISARPFPIIQKYYIPNVGDIPRWTKMHSLIDHWMDSARANETSEREKALNSIKLLK